MTTPSPNARPGNRNAAKPASQRKGAALNARLTTAARARWLACAKASGAKTWSDFLENFEPAPMERRGPQNPR